MTKISILALLFACAVSPVFPAELHNGRLAVEMDDATGRLFISLPAPEGPGGSSGVPADRSPADSGPADKNRGGKNAKRTALLFYDEPPSSFTLIHVGERILVFGGEAGAFEAPPSISGPDLTVLWGNGLVRVVQRATFLARKGTGTEDGILLVYVVENLSEVEMDVGIDLVLDTRLGEKGEGHFTLPSGAVVTTETEFSGDGVPASWVSMDGAGGGAACLRGVVRGPGVTPPDSLLFVNYRNFREHPSPSRIRDRKGFGYGPFSRNDSAVVVRFEPLPLGAGRVRAYRTILGLCGEGEYEGEASPEATSGESGTVLPSGVPPTDAEPEALAEDTAAPQGANAPGVSPAEGEPGHAETLPPAEGPPPVSGEGKTGTAGGAADEIDRINRIIEDLNRYLEGESPLPGDEEIRRLEEGLGAIE